MPPLDSDSTTRLAISGETKISIVLEVASMGLRSAWDWAKAETGATWNVVTGAKEKVPAPAASKSCKEDTECAVSLQRISMECWQTHDCAR